MSGKIPFKSFGTMVDASRNAVMTVDTFKRWMDLTASLGFNTAMLYIEDTYELEGEPYFGYLRGRYTTEELREIDAYAAKLGMDFIPCFQTLAHLGQMFHWREYHPIRDCCDILLVNDERTYALIEKMFKTFAENLRTRIVNVGMDEAHMLGRGGYTDINGYTERSEIFIAHLRRVAEIAAKYGFQITMWGDMFFRMFGGGYEGNMSAEVPEEVKNAIPENVQLICWDYDSSSRDDAKKNLLAHFSLKDGTWFAGGLWCWNNFTPENEHGIRTTYNAMLGCRDAGAENVFTTLWGDDGGVCSRFATLPALYVTARCAEGESDMDKIKADFEQEYGIPFDDFNALDGMANVKGQFFSDLFLGFYDVTVTDDEPAEYARRASVTAAYADNRDYGYIFKTISLFHQAMAVKCDLGIRIRKAYREGNKAKLESVIADCRKLSDILTRFLDAFRSQWLFENKPNGLEVQDIRIGGLIERVKHCEKRLNDYLCGAVSSIPELDEDILSSGDPLQYAWKDMVSVGIV